MFPVSKLFRAYGLYNAGYYGIYDDVSSFQSSFELTGYITKATGIFASSMIVFQSSFELTGYITRQVCRSITRNLFQSSFELTGYITARNRSIHAVSESSFKALSSLRVI